MATLQSQKSMALHASMPQNQQESTTPMQLTMDEIKAEAKRIVPPLTPDSWKGNQGKVGILGGCKEYTGAPFFVAMAALKVIQGGAHEVARTTLGARDARHGRPLCMSVYNTTTHPTSGTCAGGRRPGARLHQQGRRADRQGVLARNHRAPLLFREHRLQARRGAPGCCDAELEVGGACALAVV